MYEKNTDVRRIFNSYKTATPTGSMCVLCKGSKMLCGKSQCPILVKFYVQQKTSSLIDRLDLAGSSPPSVFVGRVGYPYVSVGPMIPPVQGDTSYMDTPEMWLDSTIEDIVSFRFQLVRGKHRVHVKNTQEGGRIVDATIELALADTPSDTEAQFLKKPRGHIALDDNVQPFGPSAPLKKVDLGSIHIDKRIEKAYYDTDLKAVEAVINMHSDGVMVSKIQRAFSVGAFGLGDNRRFVPTRWSITAVDDTISKHLREEVKQYPFVNDYLIYESWRIDNRFIVLMLPMSWSYELVEAWYPNTVWNPTGKQVQIYSDAEGYNGRTTYASIGGCYYAARLAVTEYLTKERRQARVIILREAHPGYIMPVGVWNVRENVRNALRQPPLRFDTLKGVFNHIDNMLDIKTDTWAKKSILLKDTLYQRRIDDYT